MWSPHLGLQGTERLAGRPPKARFSAGGVPQSVQERECWIGVGEWSRPREPDLLEQTHAPLPQSPRLQLYDQRHMLPLVYLYFAIREDTSWNLSVVASMFYVIASMYGSLGQTVRC